MNFLELAEKRYSVRDYADKNVEEEKLKKILAAAHAAPTAANLQPVRLLVLQTKEQLAKLPHVKEARGRGLLVGCEYDIPIALEVKHGCLDRMALITAIGDSVNRMIPPLIVTKKQIDELMIIMKAAIADAAEKYEELKLAG